MSENVLKTQQNVPIMEVKNISKRFSHIKALDNVSMKVFKGDVIGLFGNNGAGKSTLIKIISGNIPFNEGKIYMEGKEIHFNTPIDAYAAGIETVHQNSPVCANAAVFENFFIGRELVSNFIGLKIVRNREMQENTSEVLKDIGIIVPSVKAKIDLLSGGQRQAIILSRFFHWGGKIALLDEPFASLGVAEYRNALKLIRKVNANGMPIILVTHNIEYAFHVINKYVVLRHGRVVDVGRKENVSKEDIVSKITGVV